MSIRALAVADYFRSKGVPLFWLGTARGLEARVAPEQDIELLTIRIGGVRGKGLLRLLFAPGAAFIAVLQALCLCLRRRPAAALGMGGFASGPGGIAAWLLRVPLLIHEQNRIPGTTNRILARFATKIMQGFPDAFSPGRQAVTTGNPVRQEIANLPAVKPRVAGATPEALRVLVLGGSQGARKLNQIVPQGLKRLSCRTPLEARHQCGREQDNETAERYRNLGPGGSPGRAFHHRHGGGLRLGGCGYMPRRRAHHRRAVRGGTGVDPGAFSLRHRRPSDGERPVPERARRRGVVA